jgi:glutamate synthase domain-containing protein 2
VWLSSGEGSLSEHHLSSPCDRLFEIGTALFGVRELDGTFSKERLRALVPHFRAITVKLSQGAKPGAGGVLPKAKITDEIARIRNIPRDHDCHSPNRFKEFHDVASMFDWIAMLQEETGKPVGIKFCLGDRGFARKLAQKLAAVPAGQGPDFITLDGSEGGTGAAPMSPTGSRSAPTSSTSPAAFSCRWAAFRRCSATPTIARPASRLTAPGCRPGSTPTTRGCGSRTTRST